MATPVFVRRVDAGRDVGRILGRVEFPGVNAVDVRKPGMLVAPAEDDRLDLLKRSVRLAGQNRPFTRTVLVRAGYERPDWQRQTVGAYMNVNVVTVLLDDRLEKVMALLIERHIHRVVAVEAVGERLKPLGVLSAADIIYHMASCR